MTDNASVSPAALPAHAEPAAADDDAGAGVDAGAGARMRSLLPDLAPWRASADFRRLWLAGLITNFGSFLTFVALPVQMKVLTGSAVEIEAPAAGRTAVLEWDDARTPITMPLPPLTGRYRVSLWPAQLAPPVVVLHPAGDAPDVFLPLRNEARR